MSEGPLTAFAQRPMAAERVRDRAADREFARDCAFAATWAATGVMPTRRQPSMFDAWVDPGCASGSCGVASVGEPFLGRSAVNAVPGAQGVVLPGLPPDDEDEGPSGEADEPGVGSGSDVQSDPSGFEAGTICLFGAVPLEPPEPALVDAATQECFGMFQLAWPPHDCPAPCILEQPCTTASLDRLIEARDTFPQVVMSSASNLTASYWSDNLVLYPDGTTPDDLGDLSKYAAAATALILDNLDLLDWAVCLACSWSPFVPDDQVSAVVDCVRNGFLGEKVMYLVQTEAKSSGFATDFVERVDPGATPEAGNGVVIPIAEFTFPALRYAGIAGHGTTCAGAMCSALLLSAILIHEMLHLCAGDTDAGAGLAINAANDAMDCWAVQRMAANAFQWAMAQRHPELRDLPELVGGQPVPLPALPGTPTGSGGIFDPGLLADCCDKTTDRWFMSHDPPGAPWPWRDLC